MNILRITPALEHIMCKCAVDSHVKAGKIKQVAGRKIQAHTMPPPKESMRVGGQQRQAQPTATHYKHFNSMADDQVEQVDDSERSTLDVPTVDSAEPDFTQKHPLEHKWTLWFDNPSGKQTVNKYGQTLRPVYSFDTVEDFWCLYNNIRTPGQLQPSATFYLFKEGIEPKWEDPKNANGGSWTVSVPKGPNAKTTLDSWWLNTVLGMIGEQFTEGHEICGLAVLVRQAKDRVELWTKTATNEALQVSVGKQLKKMLDYPESQSIGFQVFADKLDSNSNMKAKDRYTV